MLEINQKIETVVFSSYRDPNNNEDLFAGKVAISTLEGELITMYKIIDGKIHSRFIKNKEAAGKKISDCDPNYGSNICTDTLTEVIIEAPATNDSPQTIPIIYIYDGIDTSGTAGFLDGGWNYQPKGGGRSNTSLKEEELKAFIKQEVWDEQNPYDDWNRLTQCEKDFFSNKPYHLFSARANRNAAETAALERFGDCEVPENTHPLRNTIGDAYRHAYFAALNTQSMGYLNAKALGDAHECGTPLDEIDEKKMDLKNNDWGYLYGDTMSSFDEAHFYTTFMVAVHNRQIIILQECL